MNTPSNAAYESSPGPQGITPARIPATGPLYWSMYWSVRRELWESRSIYIAPLAVAGLILLGFLIGTLHLRLEERGSTAFNPIQQRMFLEQPYNFAALLIMLTTFLVAVFYCLDALHGERRDRSILFWKSLPVSDVTTVLSKAIIPIVVLPLVTFAITVVTQWIMLLVSSAVLAGHGMSIAPLWNHFSLLPMSVMLLYHLVAIHGLWYAPIYCWLLLVSGWARRAAFLWAALPLLAIAVVEKIAFNTTHFGAMLAYRMTGGREGAAFTASGMSMDLLDQINPGHFLMSPGLWIGLAISAVFLAAAVRLRRYRGPI
jgi:ABC-2 type transport system permease protein